MPLTSNGTGGMTVIYSPNSPAGSSNLDLGTIATYNCTSGFRLNGNQSRECVGDGDSTLGMFDGSDPTCERKLCWEFRIVIAVNNLRGSYSKHVLYMSDLISLIHL